MNGHQPTAEAMTEGRQDLSDLAEQLLTATSTSEMIEATKGLRLIALSTRRELMGPLVKDISPRKDAPAADLEQWRAELADLAVDVVTATDYLLKLLITPAVTAPRLTLTNEAWSGHAAGYSDEEIFDQLTRRRLDARGTAVRLGTRLLSELRSDAQPPGNKAR